MPYRLYIFDMDGTLFRGNEPLPHAVDSLDELRRRGAHVRFVTNNSGLTMMQFADKLIALGFQADPSEILGSGLAAAKYSVAKNYLTVFVVGEPGLVSTFEEAGIRVANKGSEGEAAYESSGQTGAVVVGICRSFTYSLLRAAMGQILGGAKFIATNVDATYPIENGRFEPGAGSMVAAVKACTGIEPTVIGKPQPTLFRMILEEAGCSPKGALVIGDRMYTDVVAGNAAGCDTHLVLTGVTENPPEGVRFSEDLRGVLER